LTAFNNWDEHGAERQGFGPGRVANPEWWAENRPAAPGAIRQVVGAALNLLARQPGIGVACNGTRSQDVRRLLVGRIRYYIYYRPTPTALEVLAIWHASRGKQAVI
jgi:plasmid stabilization system protein ParE